MYRIGEEEIKAVSELILNGKMWRYTENSNALNFEKELSTWMGSEYTLALTSGTGSLICALVALGIGPGDEVIVPAYTYIATAMAPLALGAIPIIAEVDESLTLDPNDLENKITDRTKAVIPVHINGLPCDLDGIMKVANKHNLYVVEDACQAFGGEYKGKKMGTYGDIGAFSFNYYKLISCGEGGAIITNNRDLFDKCSIYHDCGIGFFSKDRNIEMPYFAGINMRISEVLAAILRVQLTRADGILKDLRDRKAAFSEIIKQNEYVKLSPVNDVDGDCGVKIGIVFDDADKLQQVMSESSAQELELGLECPFYSNRHVFSNWEAVMEKRGSLNEKLNPYTGVEIEYKKDMCKISLDYLERTLYIANDPDLPIDNMIERAKQLNGIIKTVYK